MPELPEVETTRCGIAPYLIGRRIECVQLRRPDLRWPIPEEIVGALTDATVLSVERRAKYLLLGIETGAAIFHLGMSGCLRLLPSHIPAGPHDHVDIYLDNEHTLRFTDPRRFGCLLWQPHGTQHALLDELGPEPLSDAFDGDYLFRASRGRKAAVKTFLMDQSVVVGVGNIYAAESLFRAGIHPLRAASRIGRDRYQTLTAAIKQILAYAIERGGTTLRDFLNPDGNPGYFEQELAVYGRAGAPCRVCGTALRGIRQGQRATVYCPRCQR